MNAHDSEKVIGTLRQQGYQQVETEAEAGLILYNTCSIRDKAEQKVFHRLDEYKRQHREGKRFAVLGCVAQQEGEKISSGRPMSRWSPDRPPTANSRRCLRDWKLARPALPAWTTARPMRPSRLSSRRATTLTAPTSPLLRAATNSAPIASCLTRGAKSAAAPQPPCLQRPAASPIRATPRFSFSARM